MPDWFSDEDRFALFTKIARQSVADGVIRKSDSSEQEIRLLEEGVDSGLLHKEVMIACDRSGCDRLYSKEHHPDQCECGTSLTGDLPEKVRYLPDSYSDAIIDEIGTEVDEFILQFEGYELSEVPADGLTPAGGERHTIHISPRFKIESGLHLFPGFDDAFLSWNQVPRLIEEYDEVIQEIRDEFNIRDEGRDLALDGGATMFESGPDSPSEEYTRRSQWYTLLHETSKDDAKARSKRTFGVTYNTLFEKLGAEFLHILFPHAMTFHAGGGNKPDGYLIQNDATYLVESKCYSNGFKLFDENDKGTRYIDDFLNQVDDSSERDFNLRGYIFIAHEFKESSLPKDIKSFISNNASELALEVICITDRMMLGAVERFERMYRENPSAPFRIYDGTNKYLDVLMDMAENTRSRGVGDEYFSDIILKKMETLAEDRSDVEELIASGFSRGSKYDEVEL